VPVPYGNVIGSGEDYAEKPRWFYCDGKFVETINDLAVVDTKGLPWLAADILCDGKKVADITDLVGSLCYVGDLPPTPEYILGLWSYRNNLLLKRTHTQLVVIDGEAETHSFNFPAPAVGTANNDASWLRSLGRA
jgi:hypothetical protein